MLEKLILSLKGVSFPLLLNIILMTEYNNAKAELVEIAPNESNG